MCGSLFSLFLFVVCWVLWGGGKGGNWGEQPRQHDFVHLWLFVISLVVLFLRMALPKNLPTTILSCASRVEKRSLLSNHQANCLVY